MFSSQDTSQDTSPNRTLEFPKGDDPCEAARLPSDGMPRREAAERGKSARRQFMTCRDEAPIRVGGGRVIVAGRAGDGRTDRPDTVLDYADFETPRQPSALSLPSPFFGSGAGRETCRASAKARLLPASGVCPEGHSKKDVGTDEQGWTTIGRSSAADKRTRASRQILMICRGGPAPNRPPRRLQPSATRPQTRGTKVGAHWPPRSASSWPAGLVWTVCVARSSPPLYKRGSSPKRAKSMREIQMAGAPPHPRRAAAYIVACPWLPPVTCLRLYV